MNAMKYAFAAVLVAVGSQLALAAPILTVSDMGVNGGGNQEWQVSVAPDASLFTTTNQGLGGSLAVSLAFEITTSPLLGATANTADWISPTPGPNPFTGTVTQGLAVDTVGDTVFASFGSRFFTTDALVEVFVIETQGAGPATVSWGGHTLFAPFGYTGSRIAQGGQNFDGYQGILPMAAADRGNRILRERGLQVAGWVFPFSYNDPNGPFGLNLPVWDQSNYTTPTFVAVPRDREYLAPAAGDSWGRVGGPRWGVSGSSTVSAGELQYLPDLIMFQYEDELPLDSPHFSDQTKTFTDEIAEWMAAARLDWAQNTLLFTNLAYLDTDVALIQQYMSQAKPDMLVFDHYREDGADPLYVYLRKNYEFLETYRQLANLGHDGTGNFPIPGGKYIQTFENQPPHHRNSESEQWFDVFSAWAFGNKAVISFSYNSTVQLGGITDSLLFDDNLPDQTVPVDRFFVQAEINRQSLNLGKTLVNLLSQDVRIVPGQTRFPGPVDITNPLPTGVEQWSPSIPQLAGKPHYMTGVTVSNLGTVNDGLNGDVLLSYFFPLVESDDGSQYFQELYFMVLNGLVGPNATPGQTQQLIRLDFDFLGSGINSLQRLNRDTGEVEIVPLSALGGSLYYLDLTLDGGIADLFKLNTGAPFIVSPGLENADFDNDNDVDGDDFLAWQRSFGTASSHTQGDADNNGLVDALDLSTWEAQYGQPITLSATGTAKVPEPTTIVSAMIALGILTFAKKRK